MNFHRIAAHNGVEESLEFELRTDCIEGYNSEPNIIPIGPGGWNASPKTLKPLGALPKSWKINPNPGIYRFEIYDQQTEAHPLIYIGRATSLRTRTRQYVEMVRRLLALYAGHKVVVDKARLRYVHFALARALTEKLRIRLFYYELPPTISSQALAREELLEISAKALEYSQNAIFNYRFLNELEAFSRTTHDQLPLEWKRVQDLLIKESAKNACEVLAQ